MNSPEVTGSTESVRTDLPELSDESSDAIGPAMCELSIRWPASNYSPVKDYASLEKFFVGVISGLYRSDPTMNPFDAVLDCTVHHEGKQSIVFRRDSLERGHVDGLVNLLRACETDVANIIVGRRALQAVTQSFDIDAEVGGAA